MCGRSALFAGPEELAAAFGVRIEDVQWPPRYNVAPTQPVPIVRTRPDDGRQLVLAQWGLVPSWGKAAGSGPINARAKTAATRPAFRAAFKARRPVIPASGFYEWQQTQRGEQPHFVHARDGAPLGFAGLWERWTSPEGSPLESCTILTTEANATMRPIHDRMPVILDPADYGPGWAR